MHKYFVKSFPVLSSLGLDAWPLAAPARKRTTNKQCLILTSRQAVIVFENVVLGEGGGARVFECNV